MNLGNATTKLKNLEVLIMSLTLPTTECFQFNLCAQFSNIQGYILDQDEHFIKIKIKAINIVNHDIKSLDNIVYLSKNEIKCFFKINDN